MRNLLSYFTIMLIALSSAHAALNITVVNHDTDVQSTYQYLKVCSCGGTTDVVRIKNIGQLEANYVLLLEADQPWFTLERSSIYLMPGESADVNVYTMAPCDAVGLGHYTVYVSSEYGRYRAIAKTIQTGVCENIQFDVTPDAATIEPCGTQYFELNITNTGTFRETYFVTGLGFSSPTLDAGESTILIGSYTASCSAYGTEVIPVTVTSEKNKLSSSLAVTVTVPRKYDYNIAFGDLPSPVCKDVTSYVPVMLSNVEARDNSFTLQGSPNSDKHITNLEGMTTKTVLLPFTPESEGNQRFTVDAISGNGSIEKSIQVDLPAQTCYDFTLEAPSSVNACPGQLTIPFTFTSEGTQIQQLTIDVQSNATTSTDGLSEVLRPSQQFDKAVNVQIPDADREYYITLSANNTFTFEKATTTVNAFSTESCYMITPTAHKFRVWTDQTSLPVLLRQDGIQPGIYEVRYEGQFMQPREDVLTLAPGEEFVLHFDINNTGFEPGRYVDRLTLSSHGVDYTTDFEIKLAEKGFWEKLVDAWNWSGEFLLCSILTILAALFLLFVLVTTLGIIFGFIHYENPAGWTKSNIALIAGGIIIILLLLMIAATPHVPRTYERPLAPSNASALFYEIGEGETISLNVSRLFVDPDNDSLSFTATPTEHLLVKVDKDVALIKSSRGFRGEETLVFAANDKNGGVTDSGLIRVSVVPYKQLGVLDYWLTACWYITLLFLLIAVVLASLVMLFTKENKREGTSPNRKLMIRRKQQATRTELIVPDELGRPLTRLEQDVMRQAQQLIKAENVMQAENMVVNQGIPQEQLWVASTAGKRFHKITCPMVKTMPKDKRITFSSRDDAIKGGYTPCKTCSSHD